MRRLFRANCLFVTFGEQKAKPKCDAMGKTSNQIDFVAVILRKIVVFARLNLAYCSVVVLTQNSVYFVVQMYRQKRSCVVKFQCIVGMKISIITFCSREIDHIFRCLRKARRNFFLIIHKK